MKLISMTDFVLEQDKLMLNKLNDPITFTIKVTDYALFLKQPLKLEMFIPCDDDGNVLDEPHSAWSDKIDIYEQAKEKVLFEGFEVKKTRAIHLYELFINDKFIFTYNSSTNAFLITGSTIEHLVKYNLEIT